MDRLKYRYPVKSIGDLLAALESSGEIKKYVDDSWILVPGSFLVLVDKFIRHQNTYGSPAVKKVYGTMTQSRLIHRLFRCRPLAFVGSEDSWILKTGETGLGGWESVGTDRETAPLLVKDYMSYDEICLSSLVSVSIRTLFVNPGSRYNSGAISDKSDHEPEGVLIGQVGARFEKPGLAECKFALVTREHNTVLNGYGQALARDQAAARDHAAARGHAAANFLKMFAEFYGVSHFPTYPEAAADTTGRFVRVGDAFLDTLVYANRVRIIADLFLKEANYRAGSRNKKAFCRVVGLGLGAWGLRGILDTQKTITIQVYIDLLKSGKFTSVSDLCFLWFNMPRGFSSEIPDSVSGTKIHMTTGDPADPINDPGKILVCNWAWDPNSYVGNEFWAGRLGSSGDPAAACCSLVSYVGNPDLGNLTRIQYYM